VLYGIHVLYDRCIGRHTGKEDGNERAELGIYLNDGFRVSVALRRYGNRRSFTLAIRALILIVNVAVVRRIEMICIEYLDSAPPS
jgi:hypothetical protein